jgi:hypothetical protein
LLDEVFAAIRARGNYVLRSIAVAKFLQPVLPDEPIELQIRFTAHGEAQLRASFEGRRDTALAFEGSFIVSAGSS